MPETKITRPAARWAQALADARPIPYVLAAPSLVWRGMVTGTVAANLPPLTSELVPQIVKGLETIAKDRAEHADPFDGFAR